LCEPIERAAVHDQRVDGLGVVGVRLGGRSVVGDHLALSDLIGQLRRDVADKMRPLVDCRGGKPRGGVARVKSTGEIFFQTTSAPRRPIDP
jgi:hypothetical protein